MRPSTLAWIWIAQGIGGATPALTKLALEGMGPYGLVIARQLLGTAFLVALALVGSRARGGTAPAPAAWTARDYGLLLVLSWAGFALPQLLGALGLTLSSATHGALLSPLEPIGILLGAAFVLRERLGLPHLLAAGFGALGTLLIVLPSLSAGADPRAGHLGGDLILAAGHLCWAIYTLAAKSLVARHDPLQVAIRAGAISWLPVVPLAFGEPFDPERALPALAWVVLLALLASALATVAWNRALREVSAGTMAIFVFVQPVVGLAVGVLGLGEPVTAPSLLGAALITIGVALAALRGERVAMRPAQEAS
jgi:drug/metabolite transporter (DMT)-like permease